MNPAPSGATLATAATELPTPPAEEISQLAPAIHLLRLLFDPRDNVLFRPIEVWVENEKKKSRTLWKQTQCRAMATVSDITIDHFKRLGSEQRANIFFGVAPRFGGKGFDFAWQIRMVRCLWADVDDVSPDGAIARCLENGLPRPSIVVASGTLGGHLYWLLKEPYLIDDVGDPPRVHIEWAEIGGGKKPIHYFDDPAGQRIYLDDSTTGNRLEHPPLSPKAERLRRLLQGMAATIGGDHTIDATRLLRLPGTMNRKDQRNGRAPRPCDFVECTGDRYDWGLFERFADVVIPKATSNKRSSRGASQANRGQPKQAAFVPSLEQIVQRITDSKQGEKFGRLIGGDASGYDNDESRADEALCSIIAYWTRDPATIDAIFRTSALCDDKWTSRPDYRDRTIGKALELVTDQFDWGREKGRPGKPTVAPVKLTGRFSILPVAERETKSGKICVQAKLLEQGQPWLLLDFTSANSSQTETVKKIAASLESKCGQGAESEAVPSAQFIGEIVSKVILDAANRLDAAKSSAAENVGDSVRDIVEREVPPKFKLAYRTPRGAWSEAWGREVKSGEFCTHVPGTLLRACMAGIDAGVDAVSGNVDEIKLVHLIRNSLSVLWSTLMETLPAKSADATDLKEDSEDARQFRAAVVRLWTAPRLLKNVPIANGKDIETGQVRASLASLVEEAFRPFAQGKKHVGDREHWRPLRTAVAAWWRPAADDSGMIVPLLAMRFDLFDHVGIRFDGATDQASLRRLGVRYDAFSDSPGVPDRMTGGGRLVVLTPALREEILAQPTNDVETTELNDNDTTGDIESGATERNSEDERR